MGGCYERKKAKGTDGNQETLGILSQGFTGGSVGKDPPSETGVMGLIPDLGRSYVPWSNYTHAPRY